MLGVVAAVPAMGEFAAASGDGRQLDYELTGEIVDRQLHRTVSCDFAQLVGNFQGLVHPIAIRRERVGSHCNIDEEPATDGRVDGEGVARKAKGGVARANFAA